MQSAKTTIILTTAILILTLLTAGCLKPDVDGDGYADEIDDFPNDPRYNSDNDHDGYADEVDDLDMQSLYHVDSDGDGRADEIDAFPNDPKYKDDADGDGYADKIDAYPDINYAHEKSWWMDNNIRNGNVDPIGMHPVVIQPENNLFGIEIKGILQSGSGYYSIWNETRIFEDNNDVIFKHSVRTPSNLRLDLELSSDQYRTLIAQYGSMISVTMETIDLDQDGAMDKVAVKYVGTESEWIEKFNYDHGRVRDYIDAHLRPELYPTLVIK